MKTIQSKLIDSIRDLAIQYEDTDLEISLELMNIALKHRPDGRIIQIKVKEYKLSLQHDIEENNNLRDLIKSRKVAIIPIGFRCYTVSELKRKFAISQASLPFDIGFFHLKQLHGY